MGASRRIHLRLEWANGVLAGLVVELLVGHPGLAVRGRVLVQPGVHLAAQVLRSVIVEHRHEAGGQVHLDRLILHELVEGILGQGRCAVLHSTTQSVFGSAELRELLQCSKIDVDLGQGAIRQHRATVGCARLNADLAEARFSSRSSLQGCIESIHEGSQFLGSRVVATDLADLAANRNRYPVGLQATNEGSQFR